MAGLDFLHSIGLVHDDINPHNIMLDDGGRAVIIDFDSCVPLGSRSRGGTPGWSTLPTTVEIKNDEHGLDLVAKFLRGEYDCQDFEAFGMSGCNLSLGLYKIRSGVLQCQKKRIITHNRFSQVYPTGICKDLHLCSVLLVVCQGTRKE